MKIMKYAESEKSRSQLYDIGMKILQEKPLVIAEIKFIREAYSLKNVFSDWQNNKLLEIKAAGEIAKYIIFYSKLSLNKTYRDFFIDYKEPLKIVIICEPESIQKILTYDKIDIRDIAAVGSVFSWDKFWSNYFEIYNLWILRTWEK